jgi:hypothetical protein
VIVETNFQLWNMFVHKWFLGYKENCETLNSRVTFFNKASAYRNWEYTTGLNYGSPPPQVLKILQMVLKNVTSFSLPITLIIYIYIHTCTHIYIWTDCQLHSISKCSSFTELKVLTDAAPNCENNNRSRALYRNAKDITLWFAIGFDTLGSWCT